MAASAKRVAKRVPQLPCRGSDMHASHAEWEATSKSSMPESRARQTKCHGDLSDVTICLQDRNTGAFFLGTAIADCNMSASKTGGRLMEMRKFGPTLREIA